MIKRIILLGGLGVFSFSGLSLAEENVKEKKDEKVVKTAEEKPHCESADEKAHQDIEAKDKADCKAKGGKWTKHKGKDHGHDHGKDGEHK